MKCSTAHYNVICYGRKDESVFHSEHGTASFLFDRLFDNYYDTYTADDLQTRYEDDLPGLATLPTLIVAEASPGGHPSTPARLSRVSNIRVNDRHLHFDFRHLRTETFSSEEAFGSRNLVWGESEHSRYHWAVKSGDLVAELLEFFANRSRERQPKFFKVEQWPLPNLGHVAIMMPFAKTFDPVYETIKKACRDSKLSPLRVDEIYQPTKIIDDIHSTIVQAKVVISDLSNRNPNVLYETGLAHARDCDVIMIVQNEKDVPSDLRPFRYFPYLPNEEGLQSLRRNLCKSLSSLPH